ncbi:MAG: membrane protein of unknown function [Candidatus Thorarchaeota archaeon]|nr:MAG: membrane protein of unknown function [Candidatus Thorarchaeota archaeon]
MVWSIDSLTTSGILFLIALLQYVLGTLIHVMQRAYISRLNGTEVAVSVLGSMAKWARARSDSDITLRILSLLGLILLLSSVPLVSFLILYLGQSIDLLLIIAFLAWIFSLVGLVRRSVSAFLTVRGHLPS